MSRLLAFWSAAAVMAMLAAAPASADPRPYVGTTSEVFNGGQGYFAPHRACWQSSVRSGVPAK